MSAASCQIRVACPFSHPLRPRFPVCPRPKPRRPACHCRGIHQLHPHQCHRVAEWESPLAVSTPRKRRRCPLLCSSRGYAWRSPQLFNDLALSCGPAISTRSKDSARRESAPGDLRPGRDRDHGLCWSGRLPAPGQWTYSYSTLPFTTWASWRNKAGLERGKIAMSEAKHQSVYFWAPFRA